MSTPREHKLLPVEQLQRCPTQPRRYFDSPSLDTLARSIKRYGIIEDIIVRPLEEKTVGNIKIYEIVAGERRWRAAQRAGLDKVPCIIRFDLSDLDAAMLALTENLQRKELNPIEEAHAYQYMQTTFDLTQEEIADQLDMSRPHVTNLLRLLKLSRKIQTWIVEGQLNAGHGKALAKFNEIEQEEWALLCIAKRWTANELEKALRQKKGNKILPSSADAERLERRLEEYFACPVKLHWKEKRNLITIEATNVDILTGIIEKMGYKER